jgi:hypothetical protein
MTLEPRQALMQYFLQYHGQLSASKGGGRWMSIAYRGYLP